MLTPETLALDPKNDRADELRARGRSAEKRRLERLRTADRLRREAASPQHRRHRALLLETAASLERRAGGPPLPIGGLMRDRGMWCEPSRRTLLPVKRALLAMVVGLLLIGCGSDVDPTPEKQDGTPS